MSSTTIRMSEAGPAESRDGMPAAAPALGPCAVAAGDTADCLPPGTRLRDFVIDRVLGEGGFGVVYSAYDLALGRRVAIKEYMPASLARRRADYAVQMRSSAQQQMAFQVGLKSFVKEARLLARFDHPALVKVHQFWEENGTAYFVMPYYTAPTLKQWLANLEAHGSAPDDAWLRAFMRQALDALAFLHQNECLHRDVSPENILVLNDRSPLLLDFGAARRVVGDLTQALTVILKPGYAPLEQYTGAAVRQGPWTDIYALCAVMYYVVSGRPPFASVERAVGDRLLPAADVARGRYSETLLNAIDAGLQLHHARRPQTAAALAQLIEETPPPATSRFEADPDRTVQPLATEAAAAGAPSGVRSIQFVPVGPTTRNDATLPPWPTVQPPPARKEPATEIARDDARLKLAAATLAALAIVACIAAIVSWVLHEPMPASAPRVPPAAVATPPASEPEVVAAPMPITVAPVAPQAPAPAAPTSVDSAAPANTATPAPQPAPPAGAPVRRAPARTEASAATRASATGGPASNGGTKGGAAASSTASVAPAGTRPGVTQAASAPTSPVPVPTASGLAAGSVRPAPAGVSQPPAPPAVAPLPAPPSPGVSPADASAAPDRLPASDGAAPAERAPAPIVLKAVAKPQPAFPAEALRDGVLNGRVTVTYTVQPDGTVADVRIVSAEPQQVFNRAARNAVARWRFEPIAQTTQGTVEFVFDATR